MVEYTLEIGAEENKVLKEIALSSAPFKKRLRATAIVSAAFGLIYAGFAIHRFYYGLVGDGILMAALAALFLLFAAFGNSLLQKLTINRAMKKADSRLTGGRREYAFDEDGVMLKSEFGEGKTKWSGFREWGTHGHYIYLRMLDGRMLLVDKNKLSERETEELNGLLGNIYKD